MTVDDKIRGEKLQYDIDREAAKISLLSWNQTEIKKSEEQINGNGLIYESSKQIYDSRRFWTVRSIGDSSFSGKTTISQAD